jgi:hypothetical protein
VGEEARREVVRRIESGSEEDDRGKRERATDVGQE